jgi:ribosomal protein S27E
MTDAVEEKVQCSRCSTIQYADISEAPVITCNECGKVDRCWFGGEIIEYSHT